MKKKIRLPDISISVTVSPDGATSKITRHSALGAPGEKQIQIGLTLPSVNLHLAEALASVVIQKSMPRRKGAVMAKPARKETRAKSGIRKRA